MPLPTVVVSEHLDAAPAAWLDAHAQVIRADIKEPAKLDAALATADGLVVRTYTKVNDALLAKAPRLRVVGRGGVGLDNIDVPACRRRGVEVVFTPDANTQAVVEYVLGLMLDEVRPRTALTSPATPEQFLAIRNDNLGRQLDQMTLGILGFGRIGTRLGRVARALGMRLLVHDILPESTCRASVEYDFEFVDAATLYRQSDILSIHVDGRPENRGLISRDVMALLKPSCIFINAARGMLVDAQALVDWIKLNASHGGRLILDVHDPEPPGSDYPLYRLSLEGVGIRLLPHLAARTPTAQDNMSWVVRDVIAVLEGRKPQHPAP